jgi:hypothetical protein
LISGGLIAPDYEPKPSDLPILPVPAEMPTK